MLLFKNVNFPDFYMLCHRKKIFKFTNKLLIILYWKVKNNCDNKLKKLIVIVVIYFEDRWTNGNIGDLKILNFVQKKQKNKKIAIKLKKKSLWKKYYKANYI